MRKGKYWSMKRNLSLALAGMMTLFSIQGATAQAGGLQVTPYGSVRAGAVRNN